MRLPLAAVAAVLLPTVLAAQIPASSRESAWRADLAWFAHEFPAGQKDFNKLYSRDDFAHAIDALENSVPTAPDADLVLGLMKLVASGHVGHNYVRIPQDGPLAFHRLPIGLQWFADGLAVTAATEPYKDALALRVTQIGTLSPDQLVAAIVPYVSYETDAWLRLQSQTFILAQELLRALGQVDSDGRVSVTLARPDGSTLTRRIASTPWRETGSMVYAATALSIPAEPAERDSNRNYRWDILPNTTALYVRYNRCADDPARPFAAFVTNLFAAVDANPKALDRAIVDLRANGGGDSRIINPLLDGLKARKALSSRGHLYALVGPATFSSALLNAVDLRNMKAVIVGEAPGEQLNSYGEVRPLTLPNTKLFVQYSTKYFQFTFNKKDALFEPDVKVTRTIADWRAGRDPVLEAALGR